MKKENAFKAFGEIDHRFLNEAENYRPKKKKATVLKWILPLAATFLCLSLLLVMALPFLKRGDNPDVSSPLLPPLSGEAGNDPIPSLNYEDFAYKKYDDHATLTEYLGSGTTLKVPSNVGNTPVTEIEIKKPLPVSRDHIEIVFNNNSLKSISLPDGYKIILHIGKDVTKVEPSLLFSKGIFSIEVDPENPVYTASEGVLYSKDFKILYFIPENYEKEFSFIEGLELIEGTAFHNMKNLKSITLPEGLTEIKEGAFKGSTELAFVSLPSTLKKAPSSLFQDAAKLKNLTSHLSRTEFQNLKLILPEDCEISFK